jgi:hypothetical protein
MAVVAATVVVVVVVVLVVVLVPFCGKCGFVLRARHT